MRRVSHRLTLAVLVALIALASGLTGAAIASASGAGGGGVRAILAATVHPAKTTPAPTIPTSGPGITPSPGLGGNAEAQGNGETLDTKVLSLVPLPPLQLYAYPVYTNVADPAFPGHSKQISYAWVISDPTTKAGKPPASISYGSLPTAHVTALAFGAIPVTADVTLSQPVGKDGKVEPLEADYATGPLTFTVSGLLDVVVSNVSVDGLSLHLGAGCTTVTPATLIAHATNTQYNIFLGGSLSGSVDIPAFTGCVAATGPGGESENVDALFDGTISGATNPTFLTQAGLGTYDPDGLNDCVKSKDYPDGCASAAPLPHITTSVAVPTVNPSDYDPPAY